MFDRLTYAPTHVSGPSHVTVTEKRAPTDESIRLAKEFEAEALRGIVKAHRLTTTEFDILVFEMQRRMATMKREIKLAFVLNEGRRLSNSPYILTVEVPDGFIFNRVEAFKLAMEKLGNAITAALVERFAEEFSRAEG